jgi:hypothetical protein
VKKFVRQGPVLGVTRLLSQVACKSCQAIITKYHRLMAHRENLIFSQLQELESGEDSSHMPFP